MFIELFIVYFSGFNVFTPLFTFLQYFSTFYKLSISTNFYNFRTKKNLNLFLKIKNGG